MNEKILLDLYYQMVVIRRLEERAAELYQKGKIGGFLHLYIGQEAVSTGLISARLPQDRVITAYRDHGVAVNCGLSIDRIIAELLGKSTGVSGGKGGSMHMADPTKNFWGGHAIVGAHLSIAAGLALGDKYSDNDSVTICMFGEGATNIGYFHEALNLSKVWNLPVLWVCENNKYGMGTDVEKASAVSDIIQKATGYGIPAKRVDGMDLMAVRSASEKALEFIRSKKEPYFIEFVTYRFKGHSMGDPERYRTNEEINRWMENDPIKNHRNYILEKKISSDKELKEIETRAENDVEKGILFAEKSEEPNPDELFRNVYFEER